MLSPEIFKRVRYIRIRTRCLVHTMFAGHYHSAFKGRGIEFAEVREYVPGDCNTRRLPCVLLRHPTCTCSG
jgi:uncharacterized protein (DUF58 family)